MQKLQTLYFQISLFLEKYLTNFALNTGTDFYNDQGKALVGLKGSKEKKKTVIANKMLAVLLKYLDICMTKNFPQEGNMGVLKEYFATVVPPCVNLCITLKRKDIVFENVWAAFQVSKKFKDIRALK